MEMNKPFCFQSFSSFLHVPGCMFCCLHMNILTGRGLKINFSSVHVWLLQLTWQHVRRSVDKFTEARSSVHTPIRERVYTSYTATIRVKVMDSVYTRLVYTRRSVCLITTEYLKSSRGLSGSR
jgi:hypothetical protein